jgi:hypothetical protein
MNTKRKRERSITKQHLGKKFVLPGYAFGLIGMIFLGAFLAQRTGAAPTSSTAPTAMQAGTDGEPIGTDSRALDLTNVLFSQTRNTIGDPSAPVTIIEFSDFQ